MRLDTSELPRYGTVKTYDPPDPNWRPQGRTLGESEMNILRELINRIYRNDIFIEFKKNLPVLLTPEGIMDVYFGIQYGMAEGLWESFTDTIEDLWQALQALGGLLWFGIKLEYTWFKLLTTPVFYYSLVKILTADTLEERNKATDLIVISLAMDPLTRDFAMYAKNAFAYIETLATCFKNLDIKSLVFEILEKMAYALYGAPGALGEWVHGKLLEFAQLMGDPPAFGLKIGNLIGYIVGMILFTVLLPEAAFAYLAKIPRLQSLLKILSAMSKFVEDIAMIVVRWLKSIPEFFETLAKKLGKKVSDVIKYFEDEMAKIANSIKSLEEKALAADGGSYPMSIEAGAQSPIEITRSVQTKVEDLRPSSVTTAEKRAAHDLEKEHDYIVERKTKDLEGKYKDLSKMSHADCVKELKKLGIGDWIEGLNKSELDKIFQKAQSLCTKHKNIPTEKLAAAEKVAESTLKGSVAESLFSSADFYPELIKELQKKVTTDTAWRVAYGGVEPVVENGLPKIFHLTDISRTTDQYFAEELTDGILSIQDSRSGAFIILEVIESKSESNIADLYNTKKGKLGQVFRDQTTLGSSNNLIEFRIRGEEGSGIRHFAVGGDNGSLLGAKGQVTYRAFVPQGKEVVLKEKVQKNLEEAGIKFVHQNRLVSEADIATAARKILDMC